MPQHSHCEQWQALGNIQNTTSPCNVVNVRLGEPQKHAKHELNTIFTTTNAGLQAHDFILQWIPTYKAQPDALLCAGSED